MPQPRRRRVTINDVAAAAGVSKGAVSRAFNRAERLPESTVRRIHAAAEQLGWRPNASARAIKGAPAHTIGFALLRDPTLLGSDPFFPLFLAGMERVLTAHSYAITIRFVTSAEQEEHCYRDWVAEGRVDAMVVSDLRDHDPRLALLAELGVQAIIVGDPGDDVALPAVFHVTDECIAELVDGWVDRGHTRIAHVMGDPSLAHARRRRGVWEKALAAHGLAADLVEAGSFTEAGAVAATRALMRADSPPTAIFYASDVMAAAGMRELSDLGFKVGADVAVAGFDGIPLATYLSPPLATIECNYDELGQAAGEMLLEALTGPPQDTPRRRLPGSFARRESYGPL